MVWFYICFCGRDLAVDEVDTPARRRRAIIRLGRGGGAGGSVRLSLDLVSESQ